VDNGEPSQALCCGPLSTNVQGWHVPTMMILKFASARLNDCKWGTLPGQLCTLFSGVNIVHTALAFCPCSVKLPHPLPPAATEEELAAAEKQRAAVQRHRQHLQRRRQQQAQDHLEAVSALLSALPPPGGLAVWQQYTPLMLPGGGGSDPQAMLRELLQGIAAPLKEVLRGEQVGQHIRQPGQVHCSLTLTVTHCHKSAYDPACMVCDTNSRDEVT
jgi:hypothetical protein